MIVDIATSIDVCQYPRVRTPLCCAPVLQSALDRGDAEALASSFKALADPARLRLLSYIAAQPGAEACVCFLTAPVGLSQPTVSHHLKVLNDAGLLAREKRGTWVYYRVVPQRMAELARVLAVPRGGAGEPCATQPAAPARSASRRRATKAS
jgi:ArsR family transcriptional regulator